MEERTYKLYRASSEFTRAHNYGLTPTSVKWAVPNDYQTSGSSLHCLQCTRPSLAHRAEKGGAGYARLVVQIKYFGLN